MNRLRAYPAFSTPGDDADREVEILQTDIMRFMAILGFILMVIFALVQSLPVTRGDARPLLEYRESLRRDVRALEIHVLEQQRVLHRIDEDIAAAARLRQQAMTSTLTVTARLKGVLRESATIKMSLARRRNELATLEQQVDSRRHSLTALRSRTERQRDDLRRTESRMHRLTRLTASIQQVAERRTKRLHPQRTRNAAPPKAAPSPVQPSPAPRHAVVPQQGFVLKFASAAAFNRLVSNRTVRFYAVVGRKAWRIDRAGTRPRYHVAERPGSYYEMAQTTVPGEYVSGFQQIVAAPGSDSVTWGVILPGRIIRRIQNSIAGKKGAEIVIRADGTIHLDRINP